MEEEYYEPFVTFPHKKENADTFENSTHLEIRV